MTQVLELLFLAHDEASAFLTKHFLLVKKGLLLVAHLSLFGFLFPEWRQDFGSAALAVLISLLFLSPVSRLFRMKLLLQLMGLRREMGILMGYLATVHAIGFLIDPDWFAYLITPYWPGDLLSMDSRYLFGLGAYLLTVPLLLTSNTWANRLLGGKNWKRLHFLVYPLLVLVLFHKFLRPGDGVWLDIVPPFLVLAVYILLKVLAWKNGVPPLVRVIDWVAGAYRQWSTVKKEAKATEESV